MASESEIEDAIAHLESVINAGVMQSATDGMSTTFGHMRDMRSQLADLRRQLQVLQFSDQTKPRVSSINMSGSM